MAYEISEGPLKGVVLPKADPYGGTPDFDPNKPGVVVVDPDWEGGPLEVDFSTFSKQKAKFNAEASKRGVMADAHDFYKEINSQMKTKEAEIADVFASEPALKPVTFNLDAVEASSDVQNEVVGQVTAVSSDQTEVHRQSRLLEQNALNAGYTDLAPSFAELCNSLNSQGAAINAILELMKNSSPVKKEFVMPVNTDNDTDRHDKFHVSSNADELVDTGIPFLTAKPQKPQYEAYFEMEKMGTMAARYHAVVSGQDCLALVYDTRFEDGFQYLPPNLGEESINVSVPKLNNAVFSCSSLGLHWTLGCLDVVVLIKR